MQWNFQYLGYYCIILYLYLSFKYISFKLAKILSNRKLIYLYKAQIISFK